MELEKQYVLQNYGRYPLAIRRGKGTWLYDFNGKRYLDLISGIGVNAAAPNLFDAPVKLRCTSAPSAR